MTVLAALLFVVAVGLAVAAAFNGQVKLLAGGVACFVLAEALPTLRAAF